jgi:hypothetical protein
LLTFVGGADQPDPAGGVIHYYRQMAARYGINSNVLGIPNVPNFTNVQGFYRLFRAPASRIVAAASDRSRRICSARS